MAMTNDSRRSFLKGAAPAIASGLAAASLARPLLGNEIAGMKSAASPEDHDENEAIWSHDYWAARGEIKLYMFRKRVGVPQKNAKPLPVLFLVHGSSVSSRPSFDLTVPGHGEYSTMDVFARYGFDVWTMDFEGYGRSSKAEGNSNVADGVEDLKGAVEVVARETGQQRLHFYGESSGGLRAAAFAMAQPEHIGRLMLGAFTYTGKGSQTLENRTKQVDFYRTHNLRPRDRNMIRSIFTRDKPGTSDPAVGEALADAELPFGDSVPTGTYLDMTANLPVVDPLKIQAPVLLAHGQYDGIATEEDLLDFYQKLPTPDRQLVILPGLAHSLTMGKNRALFWHVAHGFLTMPEPQEV
ncbi:MAG TPA: alpha/beta hydrolase [Candidatus Acidoferrales bacterium]|nr:alpha/beta hydrolase [Candidatus Acidoferrales bacterium]